MAYISWPKVGSSMTEKLAYISAHVWPKLLWAYIGGSLVYVFTTL